MDDHNCIGKCSSLFILQLHLQCKESRAEALMGCKVGVGFNFVPGQIFNCLNLTLFVSQLSLTLENVRNISPIGSVRTIFDGHYEIVDCIDVGYYDRLFISWIDFIKVSRTIVRNSFTTTVLLGATRNIIASVE